MKRDWILFFALVAFIVFLAVAVYVILAYPPPHRRDLMYPLEAYFILILG
jgi:hypothetical protein